MKELKRRPTLHSINEELHRGVKSVYLMHFYWWRAACTELRRSFDDAKIILAQAFREFCVEWKCAKWLWHFSPRKQLTSDFRRSHRRSLKSIPSDAIYFIGTQSFRRSKGLLQRNENVQFTSMQETVKLDWNGARNIWDVLASMMETLDITDAIGTDEATKTENYLIQRYVDIFNTQVLINS